jgi:hypothetical protein
MSRVEGMRRVHRGWRVADAASGPQHRRAARARNGGKGRSGDLGLENYWVDIGLLLGL